jgi:hypothetical protein
MTNITQTPIQNHDLKDLDGITQQVILVLGQMGITFPTPIDPATIVQFPLDITQVGLLELGELHSFWTAMYARDTGVHGVVIAQKRSLKFQMAKMKTIIAAAKDEADKTKAQQKMHEFEQQFARIDAMDVILEGVCDSHKRYADAASRELSRRQIEASLSR